ncbi:hypothetical protein [endosymbiont GvMRE of Glomus versiforme]|uniref:hypothetical protein n=1 Tax=endosymbiont GvMRE of Glomus versiforme TaxID=2039283 RepID=UPI000ECE4AE2|nr:hypothetical protein [endosymbiont GvMRE of Glomus versiforme]RHZ36010.1 hypothetical protein GvMRE_Ic3g60 [endosymbiont GvMRE of Glomus versiforme]
MTTLQEYLDEKYFTRKEKVREIDITKINEKIHINYKLDGGELDLREYVNVERVNVIMGQFVNELYLHCLKSPLTKLILGELPQLEMLRCQNNQLTSLDLSGCNNLEWIFCYNNPLANLEYPPNWIWKTWTKIRDDTKPQIPGLEKLIDISDLDNWVGNYDESKVGDVEYHKICGSKSEFILIDYYSISNLSKKVIARKLIILARLLNSRRVFRTRKFKEYEEKTNQLAEEEGMFCSMRSWEFWTNEEQQEAAVNEALNGDIELLSRLQDLPYLNPKFNFSKNPQLVLKEILNLRQQLKAVETDRDTTINEIVETGKKWREQQLKELREEKDKEITELKKQVSQLEIQQKPQTETRIENFLRKYWTDKKW